MIYWLSIILSLIFHFNCSGEGKSEKIKPNYLTLSYANSKSGYETANLSIADHNKLQNQISIYREIYNEALGLYKSKKYLDAVGKFEEAMDIYVEAETYYSYGKSLMNIGKFSESIKAYEISEALDYENKTNLYYNLACAYSLSNELESSIYNLKLSIQKGFKHFSILEQDSNLVFVRKNNRWKHILMQIQTDKLLTKNVKDFLNNPSKKIKLISQSKTINSINGEEIKTTEIELFEGIVFFKEDSIDKNNQHITLYQEGSYAIQKDKIQIELKKGKKEISQYIDNTKKVLDLLQTPPLTFELLYKENLNGFMKNDFVIFGDDSLFVLDKKKCAYIRDENSDCEGCKKQYEQKGYFCAY
ncbi:MAG TPA: hypothetical protein PK079_14460 [Leptospiraceae bacterium]|nr:hypothetical protein [Leptospiraceae bacterium]HMX31998.1 hypothetical protein [Leptospiraceae bacterium]HMZ64794.1 hypothetical protein [Leptospiraceae bacterium]HNC00583.1 hypothetical protein [Leptospiraceae bacterium]HNC57505.1 hypothetical protein [Leptospiraceae bacterium]